MTNPSIGWIGTGRMGYAMADRLAEAGHDITVWNRTKSKAEPLAAKGARVADTLAELADKDFVFCIVAGPDQLVEVVTGSSGLLSSDNQPRGFIDLSSVSVEASSQVRTALKARGARMLAAPVSGNAKVVQSGKLTIACSGPEGLYREIEPLLQVIGRSSTYVGDGEVARMVKICHNLLLAVVTQSLAEIVVLAEKGGVKRSAFLQFLNDSVMGSVFSRYKTPALVNLDWTTTFTLPLLKKDLDLGLQEGAELDVPMPVAQLVRDIVQKGIDAGHSDCDFAILLEEQAKASGIALRPEGIEVDDGL